MKRVGEIPIFGFEPADHEALGESLDVIDTKRAAKMAGSRFGYLKGKGALLEFGLIKWSMDHLVEAGLVPMVTPVLVREMALFGTGFFPWGPPASLRNPCRRAVPRRHIRDQPGRLPRRRDPRSRSSFPSAMPAFPVASVAKPEPTVRTPEGFSGFTSSTRWRCSPSLVPKTHPRSIERISGAWRRSWSRELEIPYRVVNVAAGDLGASAAKKYDIEAWFPSWNTYREITSCSNTTDYQARRLKIRMKAPGGNRLVHTLNGTAVAVGRVIIALLENHQQSDGSVVMPEALRPYLGFDRIDPP